MEGYVERWKNILLKSVKQDAYGPDWMPLGRIPLDVIC